MHRGCAILRHATGSLTMQEEMVGRRHKIATLVLTLALTSGAQAGGGQKPAAAPAFSDEEATSVLDDLQAALQSYNRKKFLAQFNSAKMPDYSSFQNGINGLFARYDSFTVTYHLLESAMQDGKGVVLADFGLDATSTENDTLDLRRHTQLRIVVAWNGREWKIVELSPRAMFE